MLNPELEELQQSEPLRFRLERILSQERVAGTLHGRVDAKLLGKVPCLTAAGFRLARGFLLCRTVVCCACSVFVPGDLLEVCTNMFLTIPAYREF